MKIRLARGDKGIALIVVMVAIFVLSVLAGRFASQMKVETKLAMNASYKTDLEWLGRSGVEYARWILAQQLMIGAEPYDSLNQVWAGGPGGYAASNSPLADVQLQNFPVGQKGKISIKMVDLERKVNVNAANYEFLQQALTLMGVDASAIPTIADSILDWIDADEATHINGAESDFYQGLNPPYEAKNGPIDDLSELLLINGIRDRPEMYSADTRRAVFQSLRFERDVELPEYSAYLVDMFTPLSNGRININTATATLQMIPGVDEIIAAQIVRVRSGPDGADGTEDDTPFRNIRELATAGLPNQGGQAAQILARYCTVRSSTFEIEIEADIGGHKKKFIAVVGRVNQRDLPILGFSGKDQ